MATTIFMLVVLRVIEILHVHGGFFVSRKGAKEAKAQRERSFAPLLELYFNFYFLSCILLSVLVYAAQQ